MHHRDCAGVQMPASAILDILRAAPAGAEVFGAVTSRFGSLNRIRQIASVQRGNRRAQGVDHAFVAWRDLTQIANPVTGAHQAVSQRGARFQMRLDLPG